MLIRAMSSTMVLPDLGSGVWVGIAIGVFGISFWIVGIVAFHFILERYQDDPPGADE